MRFFKLLSLNPYLKFIAIALVLMFVFDQFIFGGERSYLNKIKSDYYAEKEEEQSRLNALLPPEVVYPDDGSEYFEEPIEEVEQNTSVIEITPDGRVLEGRVNENGTLEYMDMQGVASTTQVQEVDGLENLQNDAESAIQKSLLLDELSVTKEFKIPLPAELKDVVENIEAPAEDSETVMDMPSEDVEVLADMLVPTAKPVVPAGAPRGANFYKADEPKKTAQKSIRSNSGRAKIGIVIDDVGMNLTQSRRAINSLPSEVTLAFLPYADKVRELSATARSKGHEAIVHIPMEAMSSDVNLGPMALRSSMNKEEFNREFNKIASSFDGYVGMNNHMGSKLTQDKQAMGVFMAELKRRNLFFLDSKTIHTSVASNVASTYGVPSAQRDVFLDHEESPAYVRKALAKLEDKALKNGTAIAIGHPKAVTLKELEAWIPTLEKKGIDLVPISNLMAIRSKVPVSAKVSTPKPAPQRQETIIVETPQPVVQQVSPQAVSLEPVPVIVETSEPVMVTPKVVGEVIPVKIMDNTVSSENERTVNQKSVGKNGNFNKPRSPSVVIERVESNLLRPE